MGSSSRRKSGSSDRSNRKRVVIGASETVRVRYKEDRPQVESERRSARETPRKRDQKGKTAAARAGKRHAVNKRQEREKRQRIILVRRSAVVALLLILVAGLIWLIAAIVRAPVFTIDSIQVTGTSHLTTEQVVSAAAVPAGSTLLQVSPGEIETTLKRDPWIAEANVRRDFPDSLVIAVEERTPAAIVDPGGSTLWVVSKDRKWLGERTAEDTGLPVVRDVSELTPAVGASVGEKRVANAVRVLASLSQELRAQVVAVSAPTVEETALITRDDVEIFVGEATEMEAKDRIARQILSEQKGSVVYINVRVIDRPTWRGLEREVE